MAKVKSVGKKSYWTTVLVIAGVLAVAIIVAAMMSRRNTRYTEHFDETKTHKGKQITFTGTPPPPKNFIPGSSGIINSADACATVNKQIMVGSTATKPNAWSYNTKTKDCTIYAFNPMKQKPTFTDNKDYDSGCLKDGKACWCESLSQKTGAASTASETTTGKSS